MIKLDERKQYRVDHANPPPLFPRRNVCEVTWMLNRDLFAVANSLLLSLSDTALWPVAYFLFCVINQYRLAIPCFIFQHSMYLTANFSWSKEDNWANNYCWVNVLDEWISKLSDVGFNHSLSPLYRMSCRQMRIIIDVALLFVCSMFDTAWAAFAV